MAKKDKYGIVDLRKEFPNDNVCLDYMFDSLHSRKCSCGGTYKRLPNRKQYQCSKCRFQIAPAVDTIFEKSSTPLTLWFHAIFIFSNAKSGISAKEMERQLNVTYKTAWRILRLIRESLSQKNDKLQGKVEVDEAYLGGRGEGGKYNENYKQVMADKARVIGAIQREGDARVKQVPDLKARTIMDFVHTNITPTDTKLMTDMSDRYDNLMYEYERHGVNHSKKEYVWRDIHINHVESFWSHLKRSIKGTHKVISQKHLQSYLDAFVFHYNNRHNDRQRFATLLSALLG